MYGKFVKLGNEYNHIWVWRYDVSAGLTMREQYLRNKDMLPEFRSIKLACPGYKSKLAA